MTATQLVRASAAAALDTEAAAARALRRREKSGQVTADHVSFTAARQHAVRSMTQSKVTASASLAVLAALAQDASRAVLHTLTVTGRDRHSPREQKARPRFPPASPDSKPATAPEDRNSTERHKRLKSLVLGGCLASMGSPETMPRAGAEYFNDPMSASQRRYEALRAYFVDNTSAAEVAKRFGYSVASVYQMATLLRSGRLNLFAEARPGPKGPRKATEELRVQVLRMRAAGLSITDISAALSQAGPSISAQTVWQILDAAGMPRLSRRRSGPQPFQDR